MGEKEQGDPRFYQILKELGELHDKKQKDYGRTYDPLANIRGSEEWGIKPWIGAMVRAQDKFKRLQKFAREGFLNNESVEDSFKDLAIYTILGLILWREQNS